MPHATATKSGGTPRYGRAFGHQGAWQNNSLSVGAVAASCAFGLVAVTSVCLVAIVISGNGTTHAKASANPMLVALLNPHATLAGAGAFSGSALSSGPAYVRHFQGGADGGERTQLAALTPAPMSAPAALLPLPPRRPDLRVDNAPLPRSRPIITGSVRAYATAGVAAAAAKTVTAAAQTAATTEAAPAKPAPVAEQRVASLEPPGKPAARSELDRRTAIYDIAAHTVFLPNGQKLEAHSGLGHRRDDPRYVNLRNRGPTPPNVYDLSLRERRFHGVRAIRLTPLDEDKMFGRDGMLAHTYMLGRSGQSFGCVSFKNYDAFLQAYLNGDINRLVVVAHRDVNPTPVAHERRGRGERMAYNNR